MEHQEGLLCCEDNGALAEVSRKAVKSPSLEIFKMCLDTVLGNLLWVSQLDQRFGVNDLYGPLPTLTIL